MNKIVKNLTTIITIVAGISAVFGVYIQYSKEKPQIEIKSITADKLTDLPEVEGLKAQYFFKDSLVQSLWKLNYKVSNSGNEIVIGEGNKKNIIRKGLSFKLNGNYRILDFSIKNRSFPFDSKIVDSMLVLNFLQWKPDEGFELSLYVEQLENNGFPKFELNEREIIGGKVVYSTLYDNRDSIMPLFEYMPRTIQSILRWVGYVVFGVLLIVLPVVWVSDLIKRLKYKKWKRIDYWLYREWIDKLVKDGIIAAFYEPHKLPEKYWEEYPYPKPIFPSNDFKSLTTGVLIFVVLSLIPLSLLIRI